MWLDVIIAALLLFPALLMALGRSLLIVDYLIYVFVLNRGIRRMVDWYQGAFNPYSPISLLPLAIALLLAVPAWLERDRLNPLQRRILLCFTGAMIYAGAVGVVLNRFSAIYAFAEYASALSVFVYVMTVQKPREVADRWMRSIGWAAIIASLYGWYQYYTIPEWDAFWVESVGFVGYLGNLVSTEMSVFSTMAERGPLAVYLALALVAMILEKKWRPWPGWFGVVLVTSVIFLTLSRTGIILPVIAVTVYVLLNRGINFARITILVAVLAVVFIVALQRLPGAERLQNRFASLGAMHEDGSLQGRLQIAGSFEKFLVNPLGLGLGSTGLSVRVSGENAAIGDNGYLEILANFGWLGTLLLGIAFYTIWQELRQRFQMNRSDPYVALSRALLVALIPAMFVANFLPGVSLIWIALGLGLSNWMSPGGGPLPPGAAPAPGPFRRLPHRPAP